MRSEAPLCQHGGTRNQQKNKDAIEGHVANETQQIAANAKKSPGHLALGPPMPLVRARGKGKTKENQQEGTVAWKPSMKYKDVGDDPYVMKQKLH